MQELVHIITYNTEVFADRIEQRLVFLHHRDNLLVHQLIEEKEAIMELITSGFD